MASWSWPAGRGEEAPGACGEDIVISFMSRSRRLVMIAVPGPWTRRTTSPAYPREDSECARSETECASPAGLIGPHVRRDHTSRTTVVIAVSDRPIQTNAVGPSGRLTVGLADPEPCANELRRRDLGRHRHGPSGDD